MNFSVLVSVYYKEKPEYFNRCMQSIWDEQTIKPNEIVLVQDGKLTNELYDIIKKWQKKLGSIIKIIPLKRNAGLGDALNIGLQNCNYELVARMDTDDIAQSDRFEKQLKVFEKNDIDICSSWVSEFDHDEKTIASYRKLPEYHNEIVKFAKKRCPINHPAVLYKKSAVDNAGGYQKIMCFEDYYLWVRMILYGARFYNIQEPLVKMRTGYGLLERRRGFKYALTELELQRKFLRLGFINYFQFFRNVIIRFVVRILPIRVVRSVYKSLR